MWKWINFKFKWKWTDKYTFLYIALSISFLIQNDDKVNNFLLDLWAEEEKCMQTKKPAKNDEHFQRYMFPRFSQYWLTLLAVLRICKHFDPVYYQILSLTSTPECWQYKLSVLHDSRWIELQSILFSFQLRNCPCHLDLF